MQYQMKGKLETKYTFEIENNLLLIRKQLYRRTTFHMVKIKTFRENVKCIFFKYPLILEIELKIFPHLSVSLIKSCYLTNNKL